MPWPRNQPARSVRPLQPEVVRRHRQHDVVAQQGDERRDVVALERVDVAGEQRLLLGIDRGVERLDRRMRGQRRPGPLQRAVHRRHAGVEQLGDLGGRPPQHLAQDQHRALPGGQVLQRGDERRAGSTRARRRPRRGRRRGRSPARRRSAARTGVSGLCGPSTAVGRRGRRAPAPSGRARRCGLRSMSTHTLLAMRYSHERSDDRPSNPSIARHARTIVSCTASSASEPEPSMR